jgi:hypothetical protein
MRTSAFKYSSLFIGLLAAAIIIFSQCFSLDSLTAESKSEVAAGTKSFTDESTSDLLVPTISATSFPASAQINFFQEASCLFEVIFTNDVQDSYTTSVDVPLNRFYSTILQVFISPNAP